MHKHISLHLILIFTIPLHFSLIKQNAHVHTIGKQREK